MRLIIHAGANKAASSSLQSYWNLYSSKLVEFGVYYKREIISEGRYFGGGNGLILDNMILKKRNLRPFFKKLIKEANFKKCNTIFISTEYIFSMSEKIENKKWFLDELSKIFDEIKIIYILRDLNSHAASTLKHRLLNHKIIQPFKWLIEEYEYPKCIINLAKIYKIYYKEISFKFIYYNNNLDPSYITEKILNLENINFDSKPKKFPKININIPLNDMIFLLGLYLTNNKIDKDLIKYFDDEYRNLISKKEFLNSGLLYENQYNHNLLNKSIDEFSQRYKYIDYLIENLCSNNFNNDIVIKEIFDLNLNNLGNYQNKLLKEKFHFPKDLEFKSLLIENYQKIYRDKIINKLLLNRLSFKRIFKSIFFRINYLINKYF